VRQFLRCTGVGLVTGWLLTAPAMAAAAPLPPQPATAGPVAINHLAAGKIKHVFVIVQEGHSFDNYFGTFPGVTGLSASTTVPLNPSSPASGVVTAHQLTTVRTAPLDNSLRAAKQALNGGAMNGFSATQQSLAGGSSLTMGYYTAKEIPYYWSLARKYVLADHFFSSALGGSTANHQFLVGAQSWAPAAAGAALPTVPTIFNRLDGAGVSWGYFVAQYRKHVASGLQAALLPQVPILGLANIAGNPADLARVQDLSTLYHDLARGSAPAVSYVVQPGQTEHAPGNIASGEIATVGLINTIMRSRIWSSSAIFLTWSDWGGWYDGVPPPQVDSVGYGFRVPLLIVSPFADRGTIYTGTADFTSILKFIETLYGLPPLTTRDQAATNLMGAFSFHTRGGSPAPVTMGSMPTAGLAHGSLTAVVVAYSVPGLLLLFLITYAGSTWLSRNRRREERKA